MQRLQEKELQVLKEIIKIIEANGLHYCAIGGTCLGAIRHGGFIPWDDDIDIALPREEYELFRTKLYKQLPFPFKKMDGDVSVSHSFVFTKIHDSSTTQIETYAKNSPDRFTGAFVDVFPIDGVPKKVSARKKWIKKQHLFRSLNSLRRSKGKNQSIHKPPYLLKKIGLFIINCFPYNHFSNALCKYVSKFSFEKCNEIQYNVYPAEELLKHLYPKSYFTDTILVDFEDIKIRIPREYDKYLKETYGNYMCPPPEENRGNWHHVYISDMEKPCSYYANKFMKN